MTWPATKHDGSLIAYFFKYKLPDMIWHNTYGREMTRIGFMMGRHAKETFEEFRFEMRQGGVEVVARDSIFK